MSRRARAALFLLLAAVAAVAAAGVVAGYRSRVVHGYGPLRRVVVVAAPLDAGRPIGPRQLESALDVRRVPARFVPPGTLARVGDALGLAPTGPAPVGSYLLAPQLRPPRRPRPAGLADDRRPVEITVTGADALLALGDPGGARVDVIVTSEPTGPGPGRTYVAAADVPLLALGAAEEGADPGGTAAATLGLTRKQALRLIAADSFARKVTLLPRRRG
jgi:Flp pilus assembly protein CpaB